MADILYNWAEMEDNLAKPDFDLGYLHGKLTSFNEYKERFPERIWLIRKRNHDLWLLGYLFVSEKRPKRLPSTLEKNFIFYDPDTSVLFKNPKSVQVKAGAVLDEACKDMIAGYRNTQGKYAAGLIEAVHSSALLGVVKDEPTIPLREAADFLKSGQRLSFPFIKPGASKSASTSHKRNRPPAPPKFPLDPLGRKRAPISPEEDQERRKQQAENGKLGEILAMQYEIERLRSLECENPEAYVDHVALRDVGAGYDFCSVWNGETRFIEVKSGESKTNSFFISSNEVDTLTELKEQGWIYLVDLSKKDDLRNCITPISNAGEKLVREGVLVPTQFRATFKDIP